jgi:hypothetical protein
MSLRILFFVALCSLSFNAVADLPHFDRIDRLFNTAKSFEFESKLGWYSGRCFTPESERAIGSILIIEQKSASGPLFPGNQKFVIYSRTDAASADIYDYMTDEEKLKVQTLLDKDWSSIVMLYDTLGFTSSKKPALQQLRLSSDGQYLVGKRYHSALGDVLACYFFKPID